MSTEYYFKGINRLINREEKTLFKIDQVINQYKDYENCRLKVNKNYKYIIKCINGKSVSTYLKNTPEDILIFNNVINCRFFNAFKKVVENNIKALKGEVSKFQDYTLDTILLKLPKTYRFLTPEIKSFFPTYDAKAWKDNLLRLAEKYPSPKQESRIHRTDDGTWVRSKSELVIYNMLLSYHFTFVYDAPYFLKDNTILHPDFTILKPNGHVLLIEHDGKYHDEYKRASTHRKMGQYYDNGLEFYEHMLFTYDEGSLSINFELLKEIILDCIYY